MVAPMSPGWASAPTPSRHGCPDYGDDNQNNGACRANHHYAAWTSQVSPPDITPPSTSLDVSLAVNDPPVADVGGPYATVEGVDLVRSGNATDTENDTPFVFEWGFDNDGQFDDATGQNPTFTAAGQDGAFVVSLRLSDSIGDAGVDCTTVTVANVAPTIDSLDDDGPVDEGTAVTVSGTASDPRLARRAHGNSRLGRRHTGRSPQRSR